MLAAILAIAGICGGCGGAQIEAANARIRLLQQQVAALHGAKTRLARRLDEQARRIRGLEQRLAPFRQRSGEAPFTGGRLRPSHHGAVKLAAGKRIDSVGERPHRAHLGKLLATRRGAVIGFWATWCKPCTSDAELHHLRRLQRQLRPYDFELVSILIDDLDKALASPKAARWLYPLWFIRDGHMQLLPRKLIQAVGLGLPLFVVVGPDGTLRWHHQGRLDDEVVRDMVTAAARF